MINSLLIVIPDPQIDLSGPFSEVSLSIHVFVGPTLPAEEVLALVPAATIHPPVAHGDLLRLGFGAGDVVVIIDGYYHQAGAVRHKEILALLAAEVRVVGCASMGALRATELEAFGMVGHGVVFGRYREGAIEADDEVAVAHGEEPPYQRYGEPLINIRHATASAVQAGVLSQNEAVEVIDTAQSLPYTSRDWRLIERICVSDKGLRREIFDQLRDFLDRNPEHADIKAHDALDTLRSLNELINRPVTLEWCKSEDWRTKFLYDWQGTFPGAYVNGIFVSDRELLGYEQIYGSNHPSRWRNYALGQIAESRGIPVDSLAELDPVSSALAAAAQLGVVPDGLDWDVAEWLTDEESAGLPPEEALLRALVRSYRPPRKAYELVNAWPDVLTDQTTRAVVAECHAINAEVAGWESGQSIYQLRRRILCDHLAAVWQLPDATDRRLLAAARDRGFGSVEEAIGMARLYYLRSHFLAIDPALSTSEAS